VHFRTGTLELCHELCSGRRTFRHGASIVTMRVVSQLSPTNVDAQRVKLVTVSADFGQFITLNVHSVTYT